MRNAPYLCPVCRDNRREFVQVIKLGREIRKDPDTGALEYAADEWETLTRSGHWEVDIRCQLCGHDGPETEFMRAAERQDARALRPRGRRA